MGSYICVIFVQIFEYLNIYYLCKCWNIINKALQVCTERDSVSACPSKPQLASSRMAIASLHCLFWQTDFLISIHAEHFIKPLITHGTRALLRNSMGHLQPISETPLGFECSGTKRRWGDALRAGKLHLRCICTTIWIFEDILLEALLQWCPADDHVTSVSDLLGDGVQDASGIEKVLQPISTKETFYGCILRVCREYIVYGGLTVFF